MTAKTQKPPSVRRVRALIDSAFIDQRGWAGNQEHPEEFSASVDRAKQEVDAFFRHYFPGNKTP